MALRVREQHIAFFGESGSGKTVLLSSFYGASQEKGFLKESLYRVVADSLGNGHRLRQNYLRMQEVATAPAPTRFAATPHSFTIKLKDAGNTKASSSRPFDALRLVWHDYPGEWFREDPSSAAEANRRIDTFRSLMRSDVALILVDGQKLVDYAGEEEKYLKSLFGSVRDGLLRLKDEILGGDGPLTEFPRIWILALSKADLHPSLGAQGFQNLVILKAAEEVAALHEVLREFVQLPEALSVGEDFILLSSAKFEPGKISVSERVGLDLVLPVASVLPLQRLLQWSQRLDMPLKVLKKLIDNFDDFAKVLTWTAKISGLLAKIPKIGPVLVFVSDPIVEWASEAAKPKLEEILANAMGNKDYLTAILTEFRLDLDRGEEDDLLIKSMR